ncbi:hypothetical protein K402DRAFT_377761 [Aulographum hederae CBS 113979]|uniref:Uncharacterized protein n=1 Tax=Aulographum hederae CBS 113979 TaxID=1176131 RepID=A0A6G1GZD3_9PEZI|nr:hypothetical protein K402DRAFT_377761 [Aulographum hederae CBS 113979]
MPAKPPRPIEKFATAVAKCTIESSAYGKCIVADYKNVHEGKCMAEFQKLKACYTAAYKKA